MSGFSATVRAGYEARVAAGELVADDRQRAVADVLDRLSLDLSLAHPGRGWLGRLLHPGEAAESPRGLYIWGGVGRGKTMLMDAFFAAAPVAAKRRVHFHAFMDEVHGRIARYRERLKAGGAEGGYPIVPVAADIAVEARLLCFDEFAVTDIADAMILGRLFSALFAAGTTVVATSNVPPDDLYHDGLNRALFLPFIAEIHAHMEVVPLDAARDYRGDRVPAEARYVTPLGPGATAVIRAQFRQLSGREAGAPAGVSNKGRQVAVPEAAGGVARFGFDALCAVPLGASDYRSIAGRYPTLIVEDVPLLSSERRNEARRFITLVDTLYDARARLVVSAAAEPDRLWSGEDGNEAFEFRRTASRLTEMRSDAYWAEAGQGSPEKRSRSS